MDFLLDLDKEKFEYRNIFLLSSYKNPMAHLKGNDLIAIGFTPGKALGAALAASAHLRGASKEETLTTLKSVLDDPAAYIQHEVFGKLADTLIPKVDLTKKDLNADGVPFRVYGEEMIEQGAMDQMRVAARLPVSVRGAIMPDGHAGYGLPIGGVLATENAIIPYGVGVDIGCFSKTTKVALADGRDITFEDLVQEDLLGKENFCFSKTGDGSIAIGKIEKPRITRKTSELIRVTLDNNESYECTPDHIHYLLDGTEIRAENLKEGDSLFPFYKKCSSEIPKELLSFKDKRMKLKDYTVIYNPQKKTYDYAHHLADQYNISHGVYTPQKDEKIRHHEDFEKLNNNPTNIVRMEWAAHWKIHSDHATYLNKSGKTGYAAARKKHPEFFAKMGSDNMKKNHQEPEFAKRRNIRAAETFKKYNKTDKFKEQSALAGKRGRQYLIARNGTQKAREHSKMISLFRYQCSECRAIVEGGFGIFNHRRNSHESRKVPFERTDAPLNHKIVKIERLHGLPIDVYCLTVPEFGNFALSHGVFVHNCRMTLSIYEVPENYIDRHVSNLRQALLDHTRFGPTEVHDKPSDSHVLEAKEFDEIPFLKHWKDKAHKQLGTSGSGNHFSSFGSIEIGPDGLNGIPSGKYLGIITHSGSRGMGANVAKHYTDLAMKSCVLPPEAKYLAWLDMNTEEGQEYWLAMNLCGEYASACHHDIHKRLAKAIGMKPLTMVENHHNFAWKEMHDGKELYVHRKGATPAGKGVLGIIPGFHGHRGLHRPRKRQSRFFELSVPRRWSSHVAHQGQGKLQQTSTHRYVGGT